jgi:hypothetical protein
VHRLKTYSAQSGYVYQYYYGGHRPWQRGRDTGTEFVFEISADRKTYQPASVCVFDEALRAWESTHGRALVANESYAVAKMALFQAFDERAPGQMKEEILVRAADVEAILETLDLD